MNEMNLKYWPYKPCSSITWEHANWLGPDDIYDILEDALKKQCFLSTVLNRKTNFDQSKRLIEVSNVTSLMLMIMNNFRILKISIFLLKELMKELMYEKKSA